MSRPRRAGADRKSRHGTPRGHRGSRRQPGTVGLVHRRLRLHVDARSPQWENRGLGVPQDHRHPNPLRRRPLLALPHRQPAGGVGGLGGHQPVGPGPGRPPRRGADRSACLHLRHRCVGHRQTRVIWRRGRAPSHRGVVYRCLHAQSLGPRRRQSLLGHLRGGRRLGAPLCAPCPDRHRPRPGAPRVPSGPDPGRGPRRPRDRG